jgi:uncharacterized membrane protein affecting hemolysin expression
LEKKERDWKFIIGMAVLVLVMVGIGVFFWRTVAEQAAQLKEEEAKEEQEAISAIYVNTGEYLKQGIFVDMNTQTVFTADVPSAGIYNKNGTLIAGDVLEDGDKVKIYGDGQITRSKPGQYNNITKMQRIGRASLEEADTYKKIAEEALN